MISNNQIKLYSSLRNKKYREIHHKFLAEGEKTVLDILKSPKRIFKIERLIATSEFLKFITGSILHDIPEVIEVSQAVLEKITSLSTPNKAILVCEIPEYSADFNKISTGLSLFLDDISDPGNLGTIMRTADWFGIYNIFCSKYSVDVYNPKVVQSTMGSLSRVKIYYYDIPFFIREIRKIQSVPLIGTVLDGENIYTCDLPENGVIVMGNESRGISENLKLSLNYKLTIPSKSDLSVCSESLNVATAAAIVMAEFRRKHESHSK
jgi:RNA methyltransferase, TrmH family